MGKNKSGIIKNCQACKKEFYVPLYRMETAKFCSIYCQNHTQHDKYKFNCEGCGKECITSPSRRNYKKKFCSIECREYKRQTEKERRQKQRASKLLNRGTLQTRTLRRNLFKLKEKKCEVCGYNEYDFCLDIHHIDKNPKNNELENISILCCMCHKKVHKKIIQLELKNAIIEGNK